MLHEFLQSPNDQAASRPDPNPMLRSINPWSRGSKNSQLEALPKVPAILPISGYSTLGSSLIDINKRSSNSSQI
jgi:hypothetical protein